MWLIHFFKNLDFCVYVFFNKKIIEVILKERLAIKVYFTVFPSSCISKTRKGKVTSSYCPFQGGKKSKHLNI